MTAIYTEDTLQASNKIQLIELLLKSQEHTKEIINSLTEEMKNLNENFIKLKSDVAVIKNVNNILRNRSCQSRGNAGKMPSSLDVSASKW